MFTLSDEQYKAARAVGEWHRERGQPGSLKPFCLAGYAGSGKSTIIPYIIEELGLNPVSDVEYLAPTGKAARVMTRKLEAAGVTRRARTIHKAIYHAPVDLGGSEDLSEEQRIALRLAGRSKLHFELNKETDVRDRKLIVCDEASMVSERESENLYALNVPILAIGDPGQLPPVEGKAGFDMGMPSFFLTEIHRQALDNPIIRMAHEVRHGKYPRHGVYGDGDFGVKVVPPRTVEIPDSADAMPTVITGTHKKRWHVTAAIREALGFTASLPQRGERVICCKNSRALPDLVNGSEATMTHDAFFDQYDSFAVVLKCVNDEGAPLYIPTEEWDGSLDYAPLQVYRGLFDEHTERRRGAVEGPKRIAIFKQAELEWFDFGWAVTCHKSQGSQWDNVLVIDESYVFRDEWRRWLYTAITRAAKTLTIVTE